MKSTRVKKTKGFDFSKAQSYMKNTYINMTSEISRSKQKIHYPEITDWTDANFNNMWNEYSESIYMVKDASWINEREDAFLAFIYIRLIDINFNFGKEGMFEDYLKDYALQKPWEKNVSLPEWTNYDFLTE